MNHLIWIISVWLLVFAVLNAVTAVVQVGLPFPDPLTVHEPEQQTTLATVVEMQGWDVEVVADRLHERVSGLGHTRMGIAIFNADGNFAERASESPAFLLAALLNDRLALDEPDDVMAWSPELYLRARGIAQGVEVEGLDYLVVLVSE